VRNALFSTPRPEPGHLLPAVAGALVIALALPIFLVAGWSLRGWGLAAVLWLVVHAIDLLLTQTKARTGNLAASGVQVFGLLFKSVGLLVVLLAAAVSNPRQALAAALTYALAYTLELGLSVATYYSGGTR
jgi:hypothetical protein